MNEQDLIKILADVQRAWGQETVTAIQNKIREIALIDTGDLGASISFTEENNEVKFIMIDYGKFQDQGVNGLIVSHGSEFSFRGQWKGTAFAIKNWANARGLNPFATARSIQNKGIKPKKFFNSVVESRMPVLEDGTNAAITDFMNAIVQKNSQQKP